MTPKQFKRRMNHLSFRVVANTEKAVRDAATAFVLVAVPLTPVLSGRARSNWRASVGAPLLVDEAVAAEGDADAATNRSLGLSLPVIRLWRIGVGPLFIANGVPYVPELDAGSSAKAPAGMTAAGLAAAGAVARRARLLRG